METNKQIITDNKQIDTAFPYVYLYNNYGFTFAAHIIEKTTIASVFCSKITGLSSLAVPKPGCFLLQFEEYHCNREHSGPKWEFLLRHSYLFHALARFSTLAFWWIILKLI